MYETAQCFVTAKYTAPFLAEYEARAAVVHDVDGQQLSVMGKFAVVSVAQDASQWKKKKKVFLVLV